MNLETRVRECIEKYRMLSQDDGVLVGVSGGPDSVALFNVLYKLRSELDLRLAVAHLIHGIRGEEAREDAHFVAQLAKEKDVPFYLREVDLPTMRSEGEETNIEALGRRERYEFFVSVAGQCGFNRIATAHTKDDQAETMFMWLLRGSGRRGLGGIPPLREMTRRGTRGSGAPLLVRPLIEASRREVMEYLSEKELEYRTDPTNLDCRSLRNWIRHRLLFRLQERIDERLVDRMAHLAEIWREEEKILEEMVGRRLEDIVCDVSLMREKFLREGKGMQRRLIRTWLEMHSGSLLGVGYEDVERALKFIAQGPVQGRLSLPRGWELSREYDRLWLGKNSSSNEEAASYSYLLPRGGKVIIPEVRGEMQSSDILCPDHAVRPESDLEAVFDSGSLPETLTVRNFRPGDRFQPLGMKGHKKVKNFFIEKKVPIPVRRTLPMLLAGEKILWIPPYGRSEVAKTGSQTKGILTVRLTLFNGLNWNRA